MAQLSSAAFGASRLIPRRQAATHHCGAWIGKNCIRSRSSETHRSAYTCASLSFRVTARLAPRKERKGPMGAGFEASEQQGDAYILTGEKTVQLQRENAVKRMDAKHLVGPMVGRGKADEVGIFHVSESSLDVMLAAIAKDDFFVGQIGTIGE